MAKLGTVDRIVAAWYNEQPKEFRNTPLHTNGRQLTSYATAIAAWSLDGTAIIVNETTYSMQTSRHQQALREVLKDFRGEIIRVGQLPRGVGQSDLLHEAAETTPRKEAALRIHKESVEHQARWLGHDITWSQDSNIITGAFGHCSNCVQTVRVEPQYSYQPDDILEHFKQVGHPLHRRCKHTPIEVVRSRP